MFGFNKSPAKQGSVNSGLSASTSTSPLYSQAGSEKQNKIIRARRTNSEPVLFTLDLKSILLDDDDDDYFRRRPSSSTTRNRNKNNRRGKKDLESMSVQELENYAVNQAEDTARSVNNCLKIVEDIREVGSQTLETLHHQDEQINRNHMMALDMDRDLHKVTSFT